MSKRLYIGNLTWGVTKEELEQFFSKVGEVVSAAVILDRDTGRSRGFGFVEMATEEETKGALELNNEILQGRNLLVREAKPEANDSGGSEIPGKNYLQDIRDFVTKETELGDTMKFSVEDKRFVVTRDF